MYFHSLLQNIPFIDSRNLTSHTYDVKSDENMLMQISDDYRPLFFAFQDKMRERAKKDKF